MELQLAATQFTTVTFSGTNNVQHLLQKLWRFISAWQFSTARKQRFQLSHLKILVIVCSVYFTEMQIA